VARKLGQEEKKSKTRNKQNNRSCTYAFLRLLVGVTLQDRKTNEKKEIIANMTEVNRYQLNLKQDVNRTLDSRLTV
jgi:hypothetical protein